MLDENLLWHHHDEDDDQQPDQFEECSSHGSPSELSGVLSVVVALLVSLGAVYGGAMVYEYGFNVETAGDSPVWHQSERDVLPGDRES